MDFTKKNIAPLIAQQIGMLIASHMEQSSATIYIAKLYFMTVDRCRV